MNPYWVAGLDVAVLAAVASGMLGHSAVAPPVWVAGAIAVAVILLRPTAWLARVPLNSLQMHILAATVWLLRVACLRSAEQQCTVRLLFEQLLYASALPWLTAGLDPEFTAWSRMLFLGGTGFGFLVHVSRSVFWIHAGGWLVCLWLWPLQRREHLLPQPPAAALARRGGGPRSSGCCRGSSSWWSGPCSAASAS